MTACEHQWEWVQPRIHTIGDPTFPSVDTSSYNAWCPKCGQRCWAHGWNVPAPKHDPVLEQER